ncbi:MAG: hypothetical protein U0165_04170 [Polyangiaceae bacterium]
MRILVVDSDEHMALTLARQLRLQGITVDAATGYEEAEKLLNEGQSLDAVVTGWNLGHGHPSGVDVLALARARCPDARRVLVSGSMLSDIDDGLGVFVQKPFRVGQLLSALGVV